MKNNDIVWVFGMVTTAKTSLCCYVFWTTVWAGHYSDYSRACLYMKWTCFALSDVCIACKTIFWTCVQKMHRFIGMEISAEVNWYAGHSKVTQGWSILVKPGFLLWHRESFALFMLVALQSVLVALQLCSGCCTCVLERPFVIYQLWMTVI